MMLFGRIGSVWGIVVALAACSNDGEDPAGAGGAGGGAGGAAGSLGGGAGTTGGGAGAPGGASGATGGNGGSLGGAAGAGGSTAGTGGSTGGAAGTGGAANTPVEQALAALPAVRQEHAVVAFRGEIFVIGGFAPGATQTVAAYDPVADTWRSVTDVPAVMHHVNAAVVGDRLFIVGFHLGSGFTTADARVFEYDPEGEAWLPRSPIPDGTERATACLAVLDQKIYLFGGARATTVADASAYDTVMDSWEVLPPLPEPREHCLAGAIGGILYVASGRAGGITGFEPGTWAYDPVTQLYSERAPIPTPRGGAAGAVLDGKLYVFGGEGSATDPGGVFPQIEAYEPVSNTWQSLPGMLVPRHGYGGAVLGGKIYLPGGATAQGFGAADDHSVFWFE